MKKIVIGFVLLFPVFAFADWERTHTHDDLPVTDLIRCTPENPSALQLTISSSEGCHQYPPNGNVVCGGWMYLEFKPADAPPFDCKHPYMYEWSAWGPWGRPV